MTISSQRATLSGLLAILLWSTSVGIIRSLTEAFGPIGGPAMIYTASTLCLLLFYTRPNLRSLPRIYLLVCGTLFVCYEIALSVSIGLAGNRLQAMEVGMINYLWPCLTILFSLFINQQKSGWRLWLGVALSLAGIVWIMKGDGDWSPRLLWQNIQANPLAYGLAFAAAIAWALYSNLTRRYARGQSGVTLFFAAVALALWLEYALSDQPPMAFSLSAALELLFMGASTALAYAAWDSGIQRGNMLLLATASYFTPVLSTLLASLWLHTAPPFSFWQGVGMITLGSLLCWFDTRSSS